MTIPEKMMGVFKTEPGYDKMDFLPLDVPKAVDDKVLIKVAFTGICGSDIHTFKGNTTIRQLLWFWAMNFPVR